MGETSECCHREISGRFRVGLRLFCSALRFLLRNAFFDQLREYFRFVSRIFVLFFTRLVSWGRLSSEMIEVGFLSLPMIAFTGISTGVVLALQSFYQLSDKGLASMTGVLVTKAMVIELGPVLTSFMVIGRCGSAICAQIGSMRLSEQINALRSMSVDPMYYLILPKAIAAIIVIPILTIFGMIMGILGGAVVSLCMSFPIDNFLAPIPLYVFPADLFFGVVKSSVFSIIMVTVSCFFGMNVRGGADGIGLATTGSVVVSYLGVLISNIIVTLFYHFFC